MALRMIEAIIRDLQYEADMEISELLAEVKSLNLRSLERKEAKTK